jgi:hypothetical protein
MIGLISDEDQKNSCWTYKRQEELEELIQNSLEILEKKRLLSDSLFRSIGFFSVNVRPSLVNHLKSKESYGFFNHPVVQPASSEDERELDDLEISVRQVADFLFDFQTIRIIDVISIYIAGR